MASRHPLQDIHVSLYNLALASSSTSLLVPFTEVRCLCGLMCGLCYRWPCLRARHMSALSVLDCPPSTPEAGLSEKEASGLIGDCHLCWILGIK